MDVDSEKSTVLSLCCYSPLAWLCALTRLYLRALSNLSNALLYGAAWGSEKTKLFHVLIQELCSVNSACSSPQRRNGQGWYFFKPQQMVVLAGYTEPIWASHRDQEGWAGYSSRIVSAALVGVIKIANVMKIAVRASLYLVHFCYDKCHRLPPHLPFLYTIN